MAKKISPRFYERLADRPNPIEVNFPALSDFVSIEDSVIFIAHRVKNGNGNLEQTVEKVRKQIKYAVKKGEIECKEKEIQFGDLIPWVLRKKTWKAYFKEFHTVKANTSIPSISCAAAGSRQPSTLEECLETNRELRIEAIGVKQENTKLKEEIERLQRFEQIHEKHIENSRIGGLKGKGREKSY